MRRFLAVVHARNLEFIRDQASLSWNLLFPLLLMVGFATIFSDNNQNLFTVGTIGTTSTNHPFSETRYIRFTTETDIAKAVTKVERHQLDLLIDWQQKRYWRNIDAPNSYIVEKMLLASDSQFVPQQVSGKEIRYIDWVVPGVLGMNVVFSALFGIGYVIVRYRKNGVLKRLRGTPLSATEFLAAQIVSRLLLIFVVTVLVYMVCDLLLDFAMYGSYWLLLLILLCGSVALVAMGLVISSRLHNEELASGLANAISWPMMMLSGVWFSLEGSPQWLQQVAQLFPLTHAVDASRAVMLEGAGLSEIAPNLLALLLMALLFMVLGIKLFRWQ